MIIDLHIHTKNFSSCSKLDPEEAVLKAREVGLDGICFTEHGKLWPEKELELLSRKYNFPVFGGMEVETKEGHVLVFGLPEDQPAIMDLNDLRQKVDAAAGAMVYAHPFRGFLLFGFSDLQLTLQDACQREIFKKIQAVETHSGKSTKKENEMAIAVSQKINIPGTGGSDAHSAGEVGRCVTTFENKISSQKELICALNSGCFKAAYLPKKA